MKSPPPRYMALFVVKVGNQKGAQDISVTTRLDYVTLTLDLIVNKIGAGVYAIMGKNYN